jgi:hypothetical protein
MRTRGYTVVMVLICGAVRAASAPVAIYDRDPEHLWNRLYQAIAMRTEGETRYGVDNAEPFREPFDDPKKLLALLDEFLGQHGEKRASGDLSQALLLSDVWAAFDLAASGAAGPDGPPIQRRLAGVISKGCGCKIQRLRIFRTTMGKP